MATPLKKLSIRASALRRLLGDFKSYKEEKSSFTKKINRLLEEQEANPSLKEDYNHNYDLKKQREFIDEVDLTLDRLVKQVDEARVLLDKQIEEIEEKEEGKQEREEEVTKAKKILAQAISLLETPVKSQNKEEKKESLTVSVLSSKERKDQGNVALFEQILKEIKAFSPNLKVLLQESAETAEFSAKATNEGAEVELLSASSGAKFTSSEQKVSYLAKHSKVFLVFPVNLAGISELFSLFAQLSASSSSVLVCVYSPFYSSWLPAALSSASPEFPSSRLHYFSSAAECIEGIQHFVQGIKH